MLQNAPWSILQYFRPALSDNWSLKPIFCIFENGHFTQVLLYVTFKDFSSNVPIGTFLQFNMLSSLNVSLKYPPPFLT